MTTRTQFVCTLVAVAVAVSTLTVGAVAGGSAQSTTDQFEPNDSFENATELAPGSYTGLEIGTNDLDVYAVDLAAGESLSAQITFSHAAGDLDAALIDASGQQIVAASETATDDEAISYVAPAAGTYYLVVYGFQNATASYDLSIETSGDGAAPTKPPGNDTGTPGNDTSTADALPDPESDVLGWENGYWANESIDVNQSDGLSEAELEAYVARSMARVEAIRGLEFDREIDVSVQSRAELANQTTTDTFGRLVRTAYYNQLFEATFIVDEETDAYDEYVGEGTATVGGYYAVGEDRIVVVAEDEDAPVIDEFVLIHELTHAAQDQYFDLLAGYQNATTLDERTGWLGLLEGDANAVAYRYEERCGDEWECVSTPNGTASTPTDFNVGIYLSEYNPYSDGPALVASLRERSGGNWSAVNEAYENPPVSSEQVIYPERYPDERPVEIDVTAESRGDWRLFGVERVGEARLYAMLFYQDSEYNISVVDGSTIVEPDAGLDDTYNYTSVPSEGWANDELRMYTDGSQYGYRWTLAWDSEADAREFRDAYLTVLAGHGAQQRGPQTWVIPETEPYGDAFYVDLSGQTVTIVNAPDVTSLGAIAPDVVETTEGGTNETMTATETDGTETNETITGTETSASGGN